jgi:hypothetical protein
MEELYEKFNFPSALKFKKILERNNVNVTLKEVNDFIEKQNIHQIHKPVHQIKEKQKFIFALNAFEKIQLDLLDYQKYSRTNKGFKFILIIVDVFSRKAFAIPILNKKPDSVLEAYEKVIGNKPVIVLEHDDGKEYLGDFLRFIKENNLINITIETGNHNSLGIINRFSRTLKTNIEKYLNFKNTTKYYDVLDKLVDAYNNTPHQSLGGEISPNDVFDNKKDYQIVQSINTAKIGFNNSVKKISNIKVGDNVRIQIKKGTFTKGYKLTYSAKIYQVLKIENNEADLTDNKREKLKNLMVVNGNDVSTNEIDEAEKKAVVERRIRKEGI